MDEKSKDKVPAGGIRRKKLGEILIAAGLINEQTLASALNAQKKQKKKLGEILIESGVLDDLKIGRALATQMDLPFVRLKKLNLSPELTKLIPMSIAEKASVIPIKKDRKGLIVAIANPLDYHTMDDLRFVTRMQVNFVVSPQSDIDEAFQKHYKKRDLRSFQDRDKTLDEVMEVVQPSTVKEKKEQDLMNLAEQAPVIRFTNSVFVDAIDLGASDIHIEPQSVELSIRCRVDGVMRSLMSMDKYVHPSLVSRIKIISGLDISERRKPQDGKAQIRYGDKRFDLRVSTIPTTYGEKVTIRILDPDTAKLVPKDLGFSDTDLENISQSIKMPQGIILVTGPTGSGKSSTLYACLNELNTPDVNIITVEDPVEFDVGGINQVQINPLAGISFASGLRSILRQDPDIVMVGEIRDAETAHIAFQAAQTGHLVLSTLHTNDAPSAVTRLLDLGLEDFQLSVSLLAVVGQRLVRKICPKCKTKDTPNPQMLNRVRAYLGGNPNPTFWKGAGCGACKNSGYTGRMGLFEMLMVSPVIKNCITGNVSAGALREAAEKEGFKTMTADGLHKALMGLTTLSEVFRVAAPEVNASPLSSVPPPRGIDAPQPAAALSRTAVPAGDGAAGKTPGNIPGSGEPLPFIGADPGERSGRLPKIMVVDDNVVVRRIIRQTLETNEFLVVGAENGKEALDLMAHEKPDLVVTDLMMPKMDGVALIQALRADASTRDIPVIMLTAKDQLDTEISGIDAGANDYLVKPIDPKRFIFRIKRLLQ